MYDALLNRIDEVRSEMQRHRDAVHKSMSAYSSTLAGEGQLIRWQSQVLFLSHFCVPICTARSYLLLFRSSFVSEAIREDLFDISMGVGNHCSNELHILG